MSCYDLRVGVGEVKAGFLRPKVVCAGVEIEGDLAAGVGDSGGYDGAAPDVAAGPNVGAGDGAAVF